MKNMCWRSHKSNLMLISILLVIAHIKITIFSNKEYYIYTSHWHLIEIGKYNLQFYILKDEYTSSIYSFRFMTHRRG